MGFRGAHSTGCGCPDCQGLYAAGTEAQANAEYSEPLPCEAEFLFDLLDDIDTADDMCKSDDKAYRNLVRRLCKRRFERATTDGYALTWHNGSNSLIWLIERYGYARREGTHQGKQAHEWMDAIKQALGVTHD